MKRVVDTLGSKSTKLVQLNFSGSNTDVSFTTAVSNAFLSPLEKIPYLLIWDTLGYYRFYIEMIYFVYSLESPR